VADVSEDTEDKNTVIASKELPILHSA